MYNQEDEIAQFFAEQDGAFTKKEPEKKAQKKENKAQNKIIQNQKRAYQKKAEKQKETFRQPDEYAYSGGEAVRCLEKALDELF